MRILLSDAFLRSRQHRPGARVIVHDSRVTGFECVIGARTKTFRLRTRAVSALLGRWPVLTADEARAKALDLLRRVAEGEAPANVRAAQVARPTLGEALTDYLAAKSLKASTARKMRERLRCQCADWLLLPLDAITLKVVQERYRSIDSTGSANEVMRYLSALFNFVAARDGVALENPVARLRKLDGLRELKPKDRMVPDAKLPAWSAAVAALADRDAADTLCFLALTGARLSEALHLTWADTDLEAGSVRFRDTKNGTDHALPLGRHLQALLCARRNQATSRTNPLAADAPVFGLSETRLRRAVAEVVAAIGLPWSPHDLRRGFVTTGQRTLNDLATVKRLVNHSAGGDVTTKHYLRLSVEDLREPMQRIESAVLKLWQGAKMR